MRLPIVALLMLAISVPAFAEPPKPAPDSPPPPAPAAPAPAPEHGRDRGPDRAPRSPLAGDFAEFTDGKIAFLRAELKPTAEQEPAFTAFVDALKKYSESIGKHRDTMREQRETMKENNELTLPTKLGLRIGSMEEDVQLLKTLQGALATFYGSLTPEQTRTANTLLGHLAR